MQGDRKHFIEAEIQQLLCLQRLIEEERRSIVEMDHEQLIVLAKEKESTARHLKELNQQRQALEASPRKLIKRAEEDSLLATRNNLLREVEAKNRVQEEVLNQQLEQLDNLMAFFRHFQGQSSVYDRKGKLR